MAAAHRLEAGADVRRTEERRLPLPAHLVPDVVERGQVEVALRCEMPVENRLGDARRPRDLGGRGPAVAALREHVHRRLEERETALGRRQLCRRDAHIATSISMMCALSVSGLVRTRTAATIAAANEMPALTSSAVCKPLTNCCLPSAERWLVCRYEARIAPMTAIPSAPPTWRQLFSTPEPTPDLSTGTAPIAAEVIGDIVEATPIPPSMSAGSSVQKSECTPVRW